MPHSSRRRRRASAASRRPARRKTSSEIGRSRFVMQSRRSAIAPTVDRILEATKGAGLGPSRRHDLAVAASEALSNAAVHGNRLKPGLTVRVTVEVTPGIQAVVEVADSGPGFDSSGLADPTHPSRILNPDGRGVFLMRLLADRVEYNEAGNHVRLTMRHRPRRRKSDD